MIQQIARCVGLIVVLGGANLSAQDQSSCVTCHLNTAYFDEDRIAIVRGFEKDVHAGVGLSCHDCHGGNPDPSLADDFVAAKDTKFQSNPFRGSPSRAEVPSFCGRCHSDAVYMRRFRPDIRVDQVQEYWTSVHGERLKGGDSKVATCTDCHGVHGILGVDDSASPVYAENIAQTCARCHADPDFMADYTLPNGDPFPTNQSVLWQASVHGKALLEKEQLSAPTCNDCHGNHGATPPGVDSISFICGHCHGREATHFRASAKHEGFQTHNLFLADAGEEACKACHVEDSNVAPVTGIHSFSECATCHGNHGVMRPTLAMFGRLPETPCAYCHEAVDKEDSSTPIGDETAYQRMREEVVSQGTALGLSGTDLFNWLVDRALELPTHTAQGSQETGGQLRPEFAVLFEKLRIGKSSYQITDGQTGQSVSHDVVECVDCHLPGSESQADQAADYYVERFRNLSLQTAEGERLVLRARRGGVEVGQALMDIEAAVDDQIELQVLVHAFEVGEESEFGKKYASGLAHANSGQLAGRQALDELAFRYKGLGVSLVFIFLVLIALGLKIRNLDSSGGSGSKD